MMNECVLVSTVVQFVNDEVEKEKFALSLHIQILYLALKKMLFP
jgi:hypothetical protein